MKVQPSSGLLLSCVLFVGSVSFGQAARQTNAPQMFHVEGTIKDTNDAVVPKAHVTFQGKSFERTVVANEVGTYDVDLPIGIYRMSARRFGLGTHERALVNGSSGETLTVDLTVYLQRTTCDIVVVNSSGERPTREQWSDGSKDLCGGVDSFPDTSDDGLPLRFLYARRKRIEGGYVFGGDGPYAADPLTSVFVGYNVLSIQADKVAYDVKQRRFEAAGHVIIADESGKRRVDSATFRIENGHAIQLH